MSPGAGDAVAKVLTPAADGRIWIGEGPRVQAFEAALNETYCDAEGQRRWLATNSCTSSIYLALQACGVGPGDEVVTTPMTCSLTNSPIVLRGARPVWADVDPLTGNIDAADVVRKVTTRTKAIVVVDFTGRPVDCDTLRTQILTAHGRLVPIIEDAAHLAPEPLPPHRGDYVALSFQAIKFLTTGDGGALLCPVAEHKRVRLLRWAGLDRESTESFRAQQSIQEAGGKFHLTDIAAAIGLANIELARTRAATHRTHAALYSAELRGDHLALPPWDAEASWWLYVVRARRPAAFIEHLTERGIEASPVHRRNDVHPGFNYPNGPLPGVDVFAREQVAIPVGSHLSSSDVARVIDAVNAWGG